MQTQERTYHGFKAIEYTNEIAHTAMSQTWPANLVRRHKTKWGKAWKASQFAISHEQVFIPDTTRIPRQLPCFLNPVPICRSNSQDRVEFTRGPYSLLLVVDHGVDQAV